jgi:hypothetical protein
MQPFVTKANLACQGAANLCYEFCGKVNNRINRRLTSMPSRESLC